MLFATQTELSLQKVQKRRPFGPMLKARLARCLTSAFSERLRDLDPLSRFMERYPKHH